MCEDVPQSFTGMPGGEVQSHIGERLLYPAADLDEPQAQVSSCIRSTPAAVSLRRTVSSNQYAAACSRSGNWLAQKRWQLRRSALRATFRTFMRFSVSPRLT